MFPWMTHSVERGDSSAKLGAWIAQHEDKLASANATALLDGTLPCQRFALILPRDLSCDADMFLLVKMLTYRRNACRREAEVTRVGIQIVGQGSLSSEAGSRAL